MTNPEYQRAARELAERFGCTDIAIVFVGRSGLIHTGAHGRHGEAIAVKAMDAALDILHPRRPLVGRIIGEEKAK